MSPVANTVGSVGRATGVEGGLRWYLKKAARGRVLRMSQDSGADENNKRRKVRKELSSCAKTPPKGLNLHSSPPRNALEYDRRTSVGTIETLPAYDDFRSPEYSEVEADSQRGNTPLQTRLLMTTSGLSISMSEESLRSLKYCLRWLKCANNHISQVIDNLKAALDQYDSKVESMEEGQAARERSILLERIITLKKDVVRTLSDAIQTVSRYSGGALPENARDLVRSQLTSLPHRFIIAQQEHRAIQGQGGQTQQSHESAIREGAQIVLVLAKEGLEMMSQVSNVLDGTIVSAEEWCEKLGRRKPNMDSPRGPEKVDPDSKMACAEAAVPTLPGTGDVAMTG